MYKRVFFLIRSRRIKYIQVVVNRYLFVSKGVCVCVCVGGGGGGGGAYVCIGVQEARVEL